MTEPAVDLVRVPSLSAQVPYAYAASVARGARVVCTAGACPLDEQARTVAPGDVPAQAEQAMSNLAAALAAAGARLADVVTSTVHVASADRADLVAAWDVVRRHFGDHDAPRTLLGVPVLGHPDQLVEVQAMAAVR